MSRVLSVLLALVLFVPLESATPQVRLPDLDNRPIDPFLAAENASAGIARYSGA